MIFGVTRAGGVAPEGKARGQFEQGLSPGGQVPAQPGFVKLFEEDDQIPLGRLGPEGFAARAGRAESVAKNPRGVRPTERDRIVGRHRADGGRREKARVAPAPVQPEGADRRAPRAAKRFVHVRERPREERVEARFEIKHRQRVGAAKLRRIRTDADEGACRSGRRIPVDAARHEPGVARRLKAQSFGAVAIELAGERHRDFEEHPFVVDLDFARHGAFGIEPKRREGPELHVLARSSRLHPERGRRGGKPGLAREHAPEPRIVRGALEGARGDRLHDGVFGFRTDCEERVALFARCGFKEFACEGRRKTRARNKEIGGRHSGQILTGPRSADRASR